MGLTIFDPGTPPGEQVIRFYGGFHDAPTANAECLLLLKDSDATHVDSVKNTRGCYKRGDIIEVLDPSKHDGNLATNPISAPFYLLRVTGVTKAQMRAFMDEWGDFLTGIRTVRRLHRVAIDALPQGVRDNFTAQRYAVMPWAQLRAQLFNKNTNRSQ